jgi:nicotinamidase-related amidase
VTRDNTAVLFIDHQVGLFTGVRDIGIAELKHNVVGLAKAAQVLGLPIVATTTARDVYAALDMPFATLMGQVAVGLAK